MEETTSITERIKEECRLAREDGVLFDSRLYESYADDNSEAVALEEADYVQLVSQFGVNYTESALIGMVGLLDGEHRGYKFCHKLDDLTDFIARFPHVVIRQKDTQIFFTFFGYAEKHEMELRRLTKAGEEGLHEDLDHIFTEGALQFITRNSTTFGKIDLTLKKGDSGSK